MAAYCSGLMSPVILGALASCDEGLLKRRSRYPVRGELGAVLEGHLLGGVVGCEAVLRLALRHARHSPQTARQLRMTRSPGAMSVTSSPTASTIPADSWPSR